MIKFIKSSQGFGLIGILIVIAVIALAGGGGFYWNETKKQQSLFETGADAVKRAEELKKQIESRDESIYGGSTSINVDVNTSDWKTYRNEKYGFEVKYPPDWSTPAGLSGAIVGFEKQREGKWGGATVWLKAQPNPTEIYPSKKWYLDRIAKNYMPYSEIPPENINENEIREVDFTGHPAIWVRDTTIYFADQRYIYYFMIEVWGISDSSFSDYAMKTFRTMLSTFEFIP